MADTGAASRIEQIKAAAAKRAANGAAFAGAPPMPAADDMVTLKEAAERSEIGRSVLERMVRDGRLRCVRESPRKTLVPIGEVAAAYAAHQAAVASSPKGGAARKARVSKTDRGDESAVRAVERRRAKAKVARRAKPAPATALSSVRIVIPKQDPRALAQLIRANLGAGLMTSEGALQTLLDRLDPPAL